MVVFKDIEIGNVLFDRRNAQRKSNLASAEYVGRKAVRYESSHEDRVSETRDVNEARSWRYFPANINGLSREEIIARRDALADNMAADIRAKPSFNKEEWGGVIHWNGAGDLVRSELVTSHQIDLNAALPPLMVSIGGDRIVGVVHSHPGEAGQINTTVEISAGC